MEQIVEYKNDPGNGYTKTLLCFLQLFIVSNRDRTFYFANNNARHFAFNAEERFLPVYEFADEDNKKITHLDSFADRFLKKCDLGRTISRYMVLITSEQKLMIMRPYQVYAVQHMVKCIDDDIAPLQTIHQQAVEAHAPTVREILRGGSRDARLIEHTLDHLLDHACIPEGLALFKSLCRHYWQLNPQATATYIHAYRDMWDSDEREPQTHSQNP